MKKTIYIKLLNEGSIAYRPVSSEEIGNYVFKVCGSEIYDSTDEEWEFIPGTTVLVKEKILEGESILIAINSI